MHNGHGTKTKTKTKTNTNPYQQAAQSMLSQGITSLSGTTGGAQGQQAAQQQQDQGFQTIQQEAQEANQLDQMLQDMGLTKEEKEKQTLTEKGKEIAQGIMTNLMGGGEGGNLLLTKEEAYANLPAGMHPLRKQYEYLKEKYGDDWANTTQAKVLESYLSGVPVERGGGLGARDESAIGPTNVDDIPMYDADGNYRSLEERQALADAAKYRENILSGISNADLDELQRKGGSLYSGMDIDKLRLGLSPEQYFNFRQQLMAADPSPGNQAYKSEFPFSSGSGLGALSRFIPGMGALQTFGGGLFPERDLSGFENYADYEKVGAGFRPLPKDNLIGINTPSLGPVPNRPPFEVSLPDPSQPEDPRYPFPIRPPFPPDGSKFPFPVGIASVFDPRFIGPSFRGSQYTNQGVSPAFLENLRRYYG
tara:strand:+ start:45 stop:1307 length:1263 start_codon:yes stop_codon:yes gene_type:complete